MLGLKEVAAFPHPEKVFVIRFIDVSDPTTFHLNHVITQFPSLKCLVLRNNPALTPQVLLDWKASEYVAGHLKIEWSFKWPYVIHENRH